MSMRLYPVTETFTDPGLYSVRVNGIPAEPDTARVSAMPFNRRWPGHQRSMDQSELASMLSFAADEPVTVEVTPLIPFDTAVIRPASMGITPEIKDGK